MPISPNIMSRHDQETIVAINEMIFYYQQATGAGRGFGAASLVQLAMWKIVRDKKLFLAVYPEMENHIPPAVEKLWKQTTQKSGPSSTKVPPK